METLETVLVVDDNPAVLSLVALILEHAKFHVLRAASGHDAIDVAAATKGGIHLLLTDIDMPGMTGPDLGQALKKLRPDIRIMLMSGGGDAGNLLVLNYGWAFIAKPFVAVKLVEMVNHVLHSTDAYQGAHEFESDKA